jgi:WD40 repeat protein
VPVLLLVGRLPSAPPPADRYGDPLPDGAVARLGSVRFLHADWVHSLAFLPDGKGLVAACQEDFVRIWDPAAGRELRRYTGADSAVESAALSPGGKRLAAGANSSYLVIWDTATGKRPLPGQAPAADRQGDDRRGARRVRQLHPRW